MTPGGLHRCVAALLVAALTGCLAAPPPRAERDGGGDDAGAGGDCGGAATLHDDFEAVELDAARWAIRYGGTAASIKGGALAITSPGVAVTHGVDGRPGFTLADGDRVTIEVEAWTSRAVNIALVAGDGDAHAFESDGEVVRVVGASAALTDVGVVRFRREAELLYWEISSDGVDFSSLWFEPWSEVPVVLRFEVIGEAGGASEDLRIAAVTGAGGTDAFCGVVTLADDFAGPGLPSSLRSFDELFPCFAIEGGELVLPAGCGAQTALGFDLVGGAVGVEVAVPAGSGATAYLTVYLASRRYLEIRWTETKATFTDGTGTFGSVATPGSRVRIRASDSQLVAEQRSTAEAAWSQVGAAALEPAELSPITVELGASDAEVRFDDLRGEQP